jgi:cytochrome c-type biogenesis protein CcmH
MTRLIRLVPLLALGLLLLQVHQGAAASDALERQVKEIATQLRCPVCQNLSIADTPSKLGDNMRALIREQLERGLTREEVIAYFVSKYGKWILLEPEHRGFNLIVWWGPVLGLLGGLTGLILMVRRWVRATTPLPTNPQAPPAPYLEQVRRDLANLAVPEEDR